jgi:hypothetical protein
LRCLRRAFVPGNHYKIFIFQIETSAHYGKKRDEIWKRDSLVARDLTGLRKDIRILIHRGKMGRRSGMVEEKCGLIKALI